jgi:Relaxase/Mobilisation nuclease domain
MICRIERGEDPMGLMKYFFDRKCFQKVFDQNAKTYPEYAHQFKEHNALRPDIKRPMYHIIVRLEPGIRPSDEEFSDLAHKLIEGMGLGFDRPYVMVKHDNERGDPGIHFHIATSRIDNSGNVYYGRNDAKLAVELSRKLGNPENFKDKDENFIPRVWATGPSIRPRQTTRESKMSAPGNGRTRSTLPFPCPRSCARCHGKARSR